jgi:hypothetical protein
MADLKDYCSPDCLTASEYFVSQMSEEPPYLRVRDPVIELWSVASPSIAPVSETAIR